ncbi:PAS domain-containing protein [Spirosoma aureum]|uniref:histidine kinase n=1 Tax=Spirosoma aureum TaxID=2692134 RepID=A0A6G9ALC2_9BACT|nr:ATP-binding protein [Spirosoma aureum]QIP13228.1 PAS domain-containing protein [Spirosoma aureum]
MNHLSSFNAAPPGFVLSTEEQAFLWQQVLAHSINGLVGLIAVREGSAPDGPIINFQYQFANQTALKDTFPGSQSEKTAIIGRLLTDFFPSVRETKLWQTYLKVIETGEAHRIEQNYKIDDREVWVVQSAAPFGRDGLLLSYTETSDLHQTARRLARQTTLLNGVLNSSPNAIVVFEAVRNAQQAIINFKITLTNRQFDELVGQADMRFTGLLLTNIYPLKPQRMDRLRQMLNTDETIRIEEFVPALGRWFDVTLNHLNDGFVATVQDITTAKQMHQQLEVTVQELHRSNHNLEQFAYVASHDLQEPLRKIVSFGDVLNDQFAHELSESAADLIRRMQTSAGRMRSLVQDLLTFSRLSGNSTTFGLVDLNHLVASVADDLELTIYDRKAQLTINILPAVWGDASLLRQLFQNLLSNALKFQNSTPTGGPIPPRVSIGGYVATESELPAALSQSDVSQAGRRFAVLTVSDNGIGFDERYLDRIFTIFQRLHGRMQYAGTGMGLAICKKVVDIHGGHITAKSQEGNGATFSIFLPMM